MLRGDQLPSVAWLLRLRQGKSIQLSVRAWEKVQARFHRVRAIIRNIKIQDYTAGKWKQRRESRKRHEGTASFGMCSDLRPFMNIFRRF